jgi:hypothetical protein
MRQVTYGLVLLLLVSVFSNCSKNKKKVTQYKTPNSIYLFDPNSELEVFKEPTPKSESLGKIKASEFGLITATIEVVNDEKSQYFSQMVCPDSIKSKCEDGKAYFNKGILVQSDQLDNLIGDGLPVEFNKNYIGIEDGLDIIEDAKALRNFLSAPSKVKEINLKGTLILKALNIVTLTLFPNPDDRLKVLSELIILSDLSENTNYTDSRYDIVYKKYAIMKDFKVSETSVFGLSASDTKNLVSGLQSQKENIEKSFYIGFPLRTSTYKGFVAQFNKFKNHYYVQEKLFQKIIENGAYTIKGLPFQYFSNASDNSKANDIIKKFVPDLETNALVGNGNLEFLGRDGVKLSVSIQDFNGNSVSKESYEIKSILAEENGNSVGFRIKTDVGEFFLIPLDITDYLLTSGQGFKEFLTTLPKDYKEILKNNNYEKAVMLVAAKFGVGGFDESTGKMNYLFSTGDKYWTILEIVRLSPDLIRDTEYSGKFVKSYVSNDDCIEALQWRQPKGEFYVSWEYGCNDGQSKPVRNEELCFSESGYDELEISFAPSELRTDKPNINIYFKGIPRICDLSINGNVFHSSELSSD